MKKCIFLITVVLMISCRKNDSIIAASQCKITSMVDSSGTIPPTIKRYSFAYDEKGRLLHLYDSLNDINRNYTYVDGNIIVINENYGSTGDVAIDTIWTNSFGYMQTMHGYKNNQYTWDYEYKYDSTGHILWGVKTLAIVSWVPDTIAYTWDKGNVIAIYEGKSKVSSYRFSDTLFTNGDYIYLQMILQDRVPTYKNKNLPNLYGPTNSVAYTLNANRNISQIVFTNPNGTDVTTYTYSCR